MEAAGLLNYIPWGGPISIKTGDLNNLTIGGLWVVTANVNTPLSTIAFWLVDVRINKQGDILQIAKAYAGGNSTIYSRILRTEVDNTWTDWM